MWIPNSLNNGWSYLEEVKHKDENKDLLDFLASNYKHSSLNVWAERIKRGELKVNNNLTRKTRSLSMAI